MKQIDDFENVKESSGDLGRPSAGAYAVQIKRVEDVPLDAATGKGDYLRIEYDIIAGDFDGYYQRKFDQYGTWNARFVRSYKERALGMFKHFINVVSECNPAFSWKWNEQDLVGCAFGAVLSEEEYVGTDGSIRTRLNVTDVITFDDLNNGNYHVRPRRTVDRPTSEPQKIDADDPACPF